MKPIQVGLLGIGTVGSGTFNVLQRNQEEIKRRAGRGIEITMVADLDVARAQSIVGPNVKVVNDARAVIANPEIDIVIELIGGYGIAKALVLEAIAAGKHVVTANKALLAVHGTEIFAAASAKGVMVGFEAAVAGGIPIIKALREGLTANSIQWIAGIINGTTNFILSEMRDKGLSFDTVLKEAQRLGYAEADPTFDIEGVDAAHKITILSALAFGIPMQFDKAYIEDFKLDATDIVRRTTRLSHQAAGHHQAHAGRRGTARASDLDSNQAIDRQCGRRDERSAGAGRCGRRDAVLRQGRGRGAHRQRGDRRPGGRHAHAHRGP
jgi:homoserine dehydrogenase